MVLKKIKIIKAIKSHKPVNENGVSLLMDKTYANPTPEKTTIALRAKENSHNVFPHTRRNVLIV